jgi:PAS domain S-box-containing protein
MAEMLTTMPDISKQSTSRKKLRQTDGRIDATQLPFLDAVKAAIIVTDRSGVITYWNPFAQELYGWSANEVVGHNILEITVGAGTEQEARQHMAKLNDGQCWSGEFQVRCKNGEFLTALVTLSPMVDASGTAIGIVGISQDLSSRKQAEAELQNAHAELEKRVQERTAELASSNESLQRLSGQLIRAQDDERRRIARELHDSTGQVLAALSMILSQMQKDSSPADVRKFEECRELIASAAGEIRNLSYLLHPPLIDEVGLASAVAEYVQGFQKRSGLTVQFEISSDVGRLDGNREITLFRIIQESLGNIHRHSGSSTAAVRISCLENDIVLEIRDQGHGLPKSTAGQSSAGVGIKGMRERLRPFGGVLQITSDHTGALVRVVLPRTSPLSLAADQKA